MTATNGHPAPEEPLNRANEVHEVCTLSLSPRLIASSESFRCSEHTSPLPYSMYLDDGQHPRNQNENEKKIMKMCTEVTC